MTLNPAELGELKINVSMEGQRLKVEVVAENAMVRDVLMANIDTLKESLSKQNVTMERFNVSTGGNYGFSQQSGGEKWVPQNRSYNNYAAMGGTFAEGEEKRVSYLTGTGQGLVDVRF
ncbi:flagellar hook-length control protein FliK [Geotalea toluenoxydans]|uniref:flagellar hook-length control protein FliK n=1 Tax=Geotalea toluenoxydans TaxID=421624 RepID=UPI0006D221EA|nr:flagellar hook-length control protein FliK [Geotalea toluenoxydans]